MNDAKGRTTRTIALLAASVLASLLCGCGPIQHLRLRDSSVRDTTLLLTVRPAAWGRAGAPVDGDRAVRPVDGDRAVRPVDGDRAVRPVDGDRAVRPARGFEAGYQEHHAAGPHRLADGERLDLGSGVLITGPDTLLQRTKTRVWHFGYTDRFFFGPSFELDMSVGGLKLDVDYRLQPQGGIVGPQAFASAETLPYGSITPRWRFGPRLALEARLALAANALAEHVREDLGLVLRPIPQLAVRLGYAWRRTSVETWNDVVAPLVMLNVRTRGPAASVQVEF